MPLRWVSFASSVLFVLAWRGSAAAEPAAATDNELLRQGLELYEALEYERAAEVLAAATLEPGNDRTEQIQIYQTLGAVSVLLDRGRQAELAFRRLVCLDQSFAYGEYSSPRIRDAFDAVRRAWEDEGRPCPETFGPTEPRPPAPVTLDHESPQTARAGEPLELRVGVTDPDRRVDGVRVEYRSPARASWSTSTAFRVSPDVYAATLPADAVQPPAVDYSLAAVGEADEVLATLGTARAPLRVPVESERRRGVAREWWFWTHIGVAVAGVATGIAVGVVYGTDEQTPPPEEVTLTVRVCDPEQGLCPR